MKVKELEVGMLLEPIDDSSFFLGVEQRVAGEKGFFPWVTIRTKNNYWNKLKDVGHLVMYLGTRKDVNITKDDISWSARYVMMNEKIYAVDPAAWRKMRPVE